MVRDFTYPFQPPKKNRSPSVRKSERKEKNQRPKTISASIIHDQTLLEDISKPRLPTSCAASPYGPCFLLRPGGVGFFLDPVDKN